jgi:hypothetical protein
MALPWDHPSQTRTRLPNANSETAGLCSWYLWWCVFGPRSCCDTILLAAIYLQQLYHHWWHLTQKSKRKYILGRTQHLH